MPAAPPLRRLNLVDGMILIAGSAACFLLTRLYMDEYYPRSSQAINDFESRSPAAASGSITWAWRADQVSKVVTLWLGMISPLLLLVRLRQPRLERARLVVQPGTAATLIATVSLAVGMLIWLGVAASLGSSPGLFFYQLSFTRFVSSSGAAIAICWMMLHLGHQWCPEAGAIDRAGRAIGWGWIIVFLTLSWSSLHQSFLFESVAAQRYDLFYTLKRLAE